MLPTPVMPLEYATAAPIVDAQARRAFGELLVLSILSGLCVGVCFLAMVWSWVGAFLHLGVFLCTLVMAGKTGVTVMKLASPTDTGHSTRILLDALAGLGLVGISIAPIVYYTVEDTPTPWFETLAVGSLGIAYGLLAATTWRHRMLYRFLADYCRASNHPTIATRLSRLGWGKTVYEGIWLTCCSLTLLLLGANNMDRTLDLQEIAIWPAMASLFGAMGFGAIWVWMIVVHAVLYGISRSNRGV